MTEGQPAGHCMRSCWIGQQLGRAIGLNTVQMRELYYATLLKDSGCSSNAARLCELFLTDDLSFKRDRQTTGLGLPSLMNFVIRHTGVKAGLAERLRAIAHAVQNGGDIERELVETRCSRGAQIARQLRFSEDVADGIQSLDEHWDGSGQPQGLQGEEIPLYSRIALLAQVVDVFHASVGPQGTREEVARRSGRWFDPRIADAFAVLARDPAFWRQLASDDLEQRVLEMEPAQEPQPVGDDYLDDIALAFGQIVDAKSPFTAGHSSRVALIADQLGEQLGLDAAERRWLRRGALLHDVGKLGVSNQILDKPGRLDPMGMGRGAAPRAVHRADPRAHQRVRRARARRWRAPREAGRHRLSARPRRAPHPPRDAHHHDGRHLRRAHRRPPVPPGDAHRAGAAGDARRHRHVHRRRLLRRARTLAGRARRVQRIRAVSDGSARRRGRLRRGTRADIEHGVPTARSPARSAPRAEVARRRFRHGRPRGRPGRCAAQRPARTSQRAATSSDGIAPALPETSAPTARRGRGRGGRGRGRLASNPIPTGPPARPQHRTRRPRPPPRPIADRLF